MTLIDRNNIQRISPWNPNTEPSDADLEANLPFTTKQEYLDWRAEWRAMYKDLSQEIRATRKLWRAEGQDHAPILTNALLSNRALARTMLALRRASKAKAERLYQEGRAKAEVA